MFEIGSKLIAAHIKKLLQHFYCFGEQKQNPIELTSHLANRKLSERHFGDDKFITLITANF